MQPWARKWLYVIPGIFLFSILYAQNAPAGILERIVRTAEKYFKSPPPEEPVSPCREKKQPSDEAIKPLALTAHTLTFQAVDAVTQQEIPEITLAYWTYGIGSIGTKNETIKLPHGAPLAFPPEVISVTLSVWAPGYGASRKVLYLPKQEKQVDIAFALSPGATVSGRVVNESGTPVNAAQVELSCESNQREFIFLGNALSDDQGNWTFDHVPANGKSIYAHVYHPDYVPTRMDTTYHEAYSYQPSEPLQIRLKSGIVVRGKVVDTEGRPLKGARVTANWIVSSPSVADTTNEQGFFQLNHCPAEKPILFASMSGYMTDYVVAQDSDTSLAITLKPASPLTLYVMDKNDNPLSHTFISLSGRKDNQLVFSSDHQALMTDKEGRCVIEDVVRPADYSIGLPGIANGTTISLKEGQAEAEVHISPEILLRLRAEDAETGRPIQHFLVYKRARMDNIEFLQPWADAGRAKENSEYTTSIFSSEKQARYRIDAEGYYPGYTRYYDKGAWNYEVTVLLAKAPMFEGKIVDSRNNPAPNLAIAWIESEWGEINDNRVAGLMPTVTSNEQGTFSITTRNWKKGVLWAMSADNEAALMTGSDFEQIRKINLRPLGSVVMEGAALPEGIFQLSQKIGTTTLSYALKPVETARYKGDRILPGIYNILFETTNASIMIRNRVIGSVSIKPEKNVVAITAPVRQVIVHIQCSEEAARWVKKSPLRLYVTPENSSEKEAMNEYIQLREGGNANLGPLLPGRYNLTSEYLYEPGIQGVIERGYRLKPTSFEVKATTAEDTAPLDLGEILLEPRNPSSL